MASFVAAYHSAGSVRATSRKKGKVSPVRRLPALIGGGLFAGVCAITGMISMHSMASASHSNVRFETALVSPLAMSSGSVENARTERNIHVRKFSRLSEQGRGNGKDSRLAYMPEPLNAKTFNARFDGVHLADATTKALRHKSSILQPSAIVTAALGVPDVPSVTETRSDEHPAFEVALAERQDVAPPIDFLPSSGPVPSFRPELKTVQQKAPTPATAQILAFARPDNPLKETTRAASVPWPDRGNGTAIYDISAGVVHMPGGEKLEAHSGIGKMRDNPDFVHVRMRGATPPSSYKLTMREALFHGVEAIRLTPESGVKPHGRDGLLAHTYMLARRGESNGCVVFKDYSRFLAAFKRGEVKRMVVVPKLQSRPVNDGGKTLVSLFGKKA
jgi:hypothetical protein